MSDLPDTNRLSVPNRMRTPGRVGDIPHFKYELDIGTVPTSKISSILNTSEMMKHPKVVPSNPTCYPSRGIFGGHLFASWALPSLFRPRVQSLGGCKISDISSKDRLHNPKYRGTHVFVHCSKWKHKETCGIYIYMIPDTLRYLNPR